MKNIRIVLSLFLLPLTLPAAPIPYSGKVAINGLNFQGDAQFTFALLDASGAVHWRNGADADSSINVPVDRGLYVVLLGGQGMNPIPNSLFLDHPELYLQVRFFRLDTGQWLHLQPDQRITSAPHALAADVANLAKLADAVKPGAITKSMLAADVLADLSATVVLPELNATITSGSITAGQLAPALLADLNRSVVITRNMLPQSVLADLNRTLLRTDLPTDVLADLNRTITRNMLPADVLADLNASTIQPGSITAGMLSPGLLADLNASGGTAIAPGSITANLLAPGLLDQNVTISPGSITKAMLAADVLADLNASLAAGSITMDKLSAQVVAKLEQNGSTTINNPPAAGSLVAVQAGQSAPAGYSLYQAGEQKTLVWEEKAPVSVARYAYDGVETLGSKIYFVGGNDGSSARNITERYDPATNQWETLTTMSSARAGLAAAVLNGELYAIGGVDLSSVEIFDPGTSQWSAGPALPSEVHHSTALTVNGKIIMVGGKNAADVILNQVLELDPATNQWSPKSAMPTARFGLKLVLFEGKVWAIGGETSGAIYLSKVEIFDPVANSWTTGPSLTSARYFSSVWTENGRIYAAGGHNGSYLNTIEVYESTTNLWTAAGVLPENKYCGDAAVLGGKVYLVAGRRDSSNYSNKVYAADLNASVAGVFDLYRRDGNASAGGAVVSGEVGAGSVTPSKLSSEVVAALKPVILQQPQSVTAVGGTSATFVTQATGGNLSYQWLQQGYAIAGGNGNVLTITDLNATLHDGNYTVTVTNAFGSTTSTVATLDVNGSVTQGLVGWWKFDETNGTVATDSSGNVHNGTLINGPTWTTGKIGGALSFDGSNDYLTLPNGNQFNPSTDDLTVTLWTQITSHAGGSVILDQPADVVYVTSSGKLVSNLGGISNFDAGYISLGVWYNIAFVYNVSQSQVVATYYANGGQLASISKSSPGGSVGDFVVGKQASPSGWLLTGLLDDLRIYDRALSAAEVTALYNMGSATSGTTTSGGGTTIVADSGPVTTEKVSDGAITTAKLSETILKYLKPEITAHPQSATVYADTNASFSVSAEGKYLNYQWKRNGVDLADETNATLTITDANATLHDGNYTVVVSNDFGSVESGAGEFEVHDDFPLVFDGLMLWLDANDSSSISLVQNAVSEWGDKSGQDNHFLQGTPALQPTYANGAVTFGGANKLTASRANQSNNLNFIFVKKSSDTQSIDFHGPTNNEYSLVTQNGNSSSTITNQFGAPVYYVDGLLKPFSNRANAFASVHTGTKILVEFIGADTSVQWSELNLGGYNGYEYSGSYHEIIIIEGTFSDSNRQKIEGYLSHKWGLADKLPATHPYKNSAP